MVRKPSRLLTLLLLCAFFHPTQAVTGPRPPVPQAAKRVGPALDRSNWPVIVAFGDSLTAGYGADPGSSYPDFLQKDLDRDGYRYRVVNLGVSGNTSKDGLDRVKDVLAQHPALVIVSFGGNDGLRGTPVTQMSANLDRILSMLISQHIKVILGGITLPPNYGVHYVKQFNAIYPQLAAKYHAVLLPFMLQGVWSDPALMQDDGIHPKAAGNAIVATNFLPLVEHALTKR